jgi:hypothetical protein
MSNKTSWWHSTDHYGTGLVVFDTGAGVIGGACYTMNREKEQISLNFSGNADDPYYDVFQTLPNTTTNAWPGDGPTSKDKTTTKKVGKLYLRFSDEAIPQTLLINLEVDWDVVQRVRPSPLPPPTFKETFRASMVRIF